MCLFPESAQQRKFLSFFLPRDTKGILASPFNETQRICDLAECQHVGYRGQVYRTLLLNDHLALFLCLEIKVRNPTSWHLPNPRVLGPVLGI